MSAPIKPAKPHTTEPASLLSHWWTIGKIALDARTKGRHVKVGWVIIERYMRAKGGGRASIRFIQTATGLSARIVVQACNELVEWGYCARITGSGTRPTEYMLNWATVSPMCNAKPDHASVSHGCNASASPMYNAKGASASPMYSEDLLTVPADKPAYSKVGNGSSPAALSGNGASAFAGAVPEGARAPGGFDEFWAVFPEGKRVKRPKAEAAYAAAIKENPGAHALIVAKAKELAEHHTKHGTELKWIKEPANWLAGKGWTEDPPAVYGKPETAVAKKAANPASARKPKAKPTAPKANNDNMPAARTAWQRVEIVKSAVIDVPGGNALRATIHAEGGTEVIETINLESQKHEVQDAGQRQFSALRTAVGVDDIEDSAELHNRPFERRVVGGKPEYRAIIANAA